MVKTPVKLGRPAGMRARQLELKQTLLEHPDVPKVVEKVVSAALDYEHKNQIGGALAPLYSLHQLTNCHLHCRIIA
jgi:hypothetical protein